MSAIRNTPDSHYSVEKVAWRSLISCSGARKTPFSTASARPGLPKTGRTPATAQRDSRYPPAPLQQPSGTSQSLPAPLQQPSGIPATFPHPCSSLSELSDAFLHPCNSPAGGDGVRRHEIFLYNFERTHRK
jgi:hypothetical protein